MRIFAFISNENTEKAMLVSLIVLLGVILYLKLIKGLKQKRLSNSFASIIGYDIIQNELRIDYALPGPLESEFSFKDSKGNVVHSAPVSHDAAGEFFVFVPVSTFSEDQVILHLSTGKQKITKKIYLTI